MFSALFVLALKRWNACTYNTKLGFLPVNSQRMPDINTNTLITTNASISSRVAIISTSSRVSSFMVL
jgi:hypothetical protein